MKKILEENQCVTAGGFAAALYTGKASIREMFSDIDIFFFDEADYNKTVTGFILNDDKNTGLTSRSQYNRQNYYVTTCAFDSGLKLQMILNKDPIKRNVPWLFKSFDMDCCKFAYSDRSKWLDPDGERSFKRGVLSFNLSDTNSFKIYDWKPMVMRLHKYWRRYNLVIGADDLFRAFNLFTFEKYMMPRVIDDLKGLIPKVDKPEDLEFLVKLYNMDLSCR